MISRKATTAVAIVITLSSLPKAVIARDVTKAVTNALIRVFAIKITERSLFTLSNNHNVEIASLLPRFAKCLKRWRLIAIKAVSVIEKKAESRIKPDRPSNCAHRGTSLMLWSVAAMRVWSRDYDQSWYRVNDFFLPQNGRDPRALVYRGFLPNLQLRQRPYRPPCSPLLRCSQVPPTM